MFTHCMHDGRLSDHNFTVFLYVLLRYGEYILGIGYFNEHLKIHVGSPPPPFPFLLLPSFLFSSTFLPSLFPRFLSLQRYTI